MTDERQHRFPFTTIALTVLLMLILYIGAYYCLVYVDTKVSFAPPRHHFYDNSTPGYRYGKQYHAATFFAPAHAIDKMVRPDEWSNHRD